LAFLHVVFISYLACKVLLQVQHHTFIHCIYIWVMMHTTNLVCIFGKVEDKIAHAWFNLKE
jgi:hypothetical protein